MIVSKSLGIWMDHSHAHVMEFTTDIKTTVVKSNFNHEEKEHSLGRSEDLMHNKEQHRHAEYYKKLGNIIKNYNKVLLFGPTSAKFELFNILKENHLFANIEIEVKQTEKMTENQEHAFVRDHFSHH